VEATAAGRFFAGGFSTSEEDASLPRLLEVRTLGLTSSSLLSSVDRHVVSYEQHEQSEENIPNSTTSCFTAALARVDLGGMAAGDCVSAVNRGQGGGSEE